MRNSALMRPGRDVITITRCDRYTDSNTECVTKMTVLRRLRHSDEQIVVEPETGDLVKRGERLVHQKNIGIGDQRARQRNPHLHAAGQFARIGIGKFGKPDLRQRLLDARIRLRAGACASFSGNRTFSRTLVQGISVGS